jgi:hypothetical protein
MAWAPIGAGNTKYIKLGCKKHMSTMQHNKSSRETATTKDQQETYVMRLEGLQTEEKTTFHKKVHPEQPPI